MKIECEHDFYLFYQTIVTKFCKFHDFCLISIRMRSAKLGNCLKLKLLVEETMNPAYIFNTVVTEIKYLNKLLSFPTEWGDNRIGVSDRSIIPDDRFTASSYYDDRYKPHYARLNGKGWGWAPKTRDDPSDYLQIDLGAVFVIRAVATQGNSLGFEWTTEYKISTSTDSTHWTMYQSGGKVKVRTCAVIILYWEDVAWSNILSYFVKLYL